MPDNADNDDVFALNVVKGCDYDTTLPLRRVISLVKLI